MAELKKPGLLIVDAWTKWAGPCESMHNFFKKLRNEFGADIRIIVVQAQSNNIPILAQRNENKSMPTFVFFLNEEVINIVKGCNSPLIEKFVRETIETMKSGGTVSPIKEGEPKLVPKGASLKNINDVNAPIEDPPEGLQQTFGLIKPDITLSKPHHIQDIKEMIINNGFKIVRQKVVVLTKDQAREFYKEHSEKPFFQSLIAYMTSGPLVTMMLRRENAVVAWREMMGSANSVRAKEQQPKSIRALFGTDGQKNAVHGSDSPASAARELSFIFSEQVREVDIVHVEDETPQRTISFLFPELVKDYVLKGFPIHPTANKEKGSKMDLMNAGHEHFMHMGSASNSNISEGEKLTNEILYRALLKGLEVSKVEQLTISKNQAADLVKENFPSVLPDDLEQMSNNISSGPSIVFVFFGMNAVENWLTVIGNGPPSKSKKDSPDSFIARYGTDDIHWGTLAATSFDNAYRDIDIFFPYKNHPASAALGVDRLETTVGIIKPEAVKNGNVDAILQKITEQGFEITQKKEISFTSEQIADFYGALQDRPFYPQLVAYMTSGPCVLLRLVKKNAILAWREFIGPSDPNKARVEFPNSLRGIFGTDILHNAIYGSDSMLAASKDVRTFFSNNEPYGSTNLETINMEKSSRPSTAKHTSQVDKTEPETLPKSKSTKNLGSKTSVAKSDTKKSNAALNSVTMKKSGDMKKSATTINSDAKKSNSAIASEASASSKVLLNLKKDANKSMENISEKGETPLPIKKVVAENSKSQEISQNNDATGSGLKQSESVKLNEEPKGDNNMKKSTSVSADLKKSGNIKKSTTELKKSAADLKKSTGNLKKSGADLSKSKTELKKSSNELTKNASELAKSVKELS